MATTVGRLSDILVSFILTVVFIRLRALVAELPPLAAGVCLHWVERTGRELLSLTTSLSPLGESLMSLELGLSNIHKTVFCREVFTQGAGHNLLSGYPVISPRLPPQAFKEKYPYAFQRHWGGGCQFNKTICKISPF